MATDVAFGVEGIEVVEIVHDAANRRSEGVPARLGYRRVAAFTSTAKARCETGIKVRWSVRRAEWLGRGRPSSVRSTREHRQSLATQRRSRVTAYSANSPTGQETPVSPRPQ